VAPTSSNAHDESRVPPELKQSFSIAYAHVVAPVVDRILDIVEYFCDNNARLNTQNPTLESVRFAASAVAGTFRILDGVRSLVPTLTKLCEVTSDKQSQISGGGENDALAQNSVASFLCMKLHKTTVKYAARALEGIVKSVSEGVQVHPSKITLGVAPISVDVVAAIRLLCPYVSAYNSVSKRT
jgi:exocyst complex protein 7